VEWVLNENVRNMFYRRKAHGGEIPIKIQNQNMVSRGFIDSAQLVKTQEVGLPHSRDRAYSLYLRITKMKAYMGDRMGRTFISFTCRPLPLSAVLTNRHHNPYKNKKSHAKGTKWHEDYARCCEELGVKRVQTNLSKLQHFTLIVKGTSERQLKTLAVAVSAMEDAGLNPWKERYVCQVDIILAINKSN
jgi:site-specific DNA-cytosine methylase